MSNPMPQLESLYVWLIETEGDPEAPIQVVVEIDGLPCYRPLIAATLDLATDMRALAEEAQAHLGGQVRLSQWNRVELGTPA